MSVFGGQYSSYYDLFYADKNYVAEAAFVCDVIRRHRSSVHSVLDLGCGSGRHATEMARSGLAVTGIDRSPEMIAHGLERSEQEAPNLRRLLTFVRADATRYSSDTTYDAVVSLFHVINYQTTNAALSGLLRSARTALSAGGVFVFDFWYGPAVLVERPQVRVRRLKTKNADVIRIAEPELDINRNVVDVKYTLIAIDKSTGSAQQAEEVHSMRYLFLPEIDLLASQAGFEVVEVGEWLTAGRLHQQCWSGYVAARAVGDLE